MSNVHRLRVSDRVFFVTVNLRREVKPFSLPEYPLLIGALEGARRRFGFLLCGYVLMPDHGHALIWAAYSLTISWIIQDVKKVSARRLHARRGTEAGSHDTLFVSWVLRGARDNVAACRTFIGWGLQIAFSS